jgi:hypothetical protein
LLVLARNWDRFGGRCHEIFNALLISEVFNLDFAFVWPKIAIFPEVDEQILFFSPEFVSKYLINDVPSNISFLKFTPNVSKSELQLQIDSFQSDTIQLTNFFEIPKIIDVDTHKLFADLKYKVWSRDVLNLAENISQVMKNKRICVTIHYRCGDLVLGDFNQYPEPSKFIPYAVVRNYLMSNSDENVVVISDTPQITGVLESLHTNVYGSESLFDERDFYRVSRDIIDLIVLQESEKIVAPQSSAFSKLGAHLSGVELIDLVALITEEDWRIIFELALKADTYKEFDINIGTLLQSRDISWLISSRISHITLKDFNIAIDVACKADPFNLVVQSQKAVGLLCLGKYREALHTSLISEFLAK